MLRSRAVPRRLAVAAAAALAASVLALIFTVQAGVERMHAGEAVPWAGFLRARFTDCYAYALLLPPLLWLVRRFPLDQAAWATRLPAYLAASLVLAVAKEAVFVAVGNWFRPGVFALSDLLAEDYASEVVACWVMIGIAQLTAAGGKRPTPAPHPRERGDGASFVVRERDGYRIVPREEVELIEAQGNYARLDGRHMVRETMAALERRLAPDFVRVHRGVIVRGSRVARVEALSHGAYRITLRSGQSLSSGRSYAAAVRSLLG